MKILHLTSYILELFKVNLFAYFTFYILNILTNSFVGYYINFLYWLWFLIFTGVILLVLKYVKK